MLSSRAFEAGKNLGVINGPFSDQASLGQRNALVHTPDLNNSENTQALTNVALAKIAKYGGPTPTYIQPILVKSYLYESTAPDMRMVARFEVPTLSDGQLGALEQLTRATYRTFVKTTSAQATEFPQTHVYKGNLHSIIQGWYFGPETSSYPDSLAKGLFVGKDFGEVDRVNFCSTDPNNIKYIVEVREKDMYQTDLVEFMTQVGAILGGGEPVSHRNLLYEVYYDLMRLGLKKVTADDIYGMEEIYSPVRRGLLIPLANKAASRSMGGSPQSVLLIGVPGTGKSRLAQRILNEDDYGVLFVPLDPAELSGDLAKSPDQQSLLPRTSQISKDTQLPVVLHLDDANLLIRNDDQKEESSPRTKSKLLNLMDGVEENGFYIIAATNAPWEIDQRLLQHNRFGIRLYTPPPDERTRMGILDIHFPMGTWRLNLPLFQSETLRQRTIAELARDALTDGYTSREVTEIATAAKSHMLERVCNATGKWSGLTEEDLDGYHFVVEDIEFAYSWVKAHCKPQTTREWDNRIRKWFDEGHGQSMGFQSKTSEKGRVFSPEFYGDLEEAQRNAIQ